MVTARKRTESAQDIADPISVVTAQTIANADIRNVQEAVRMTPNLVVLDGLYPGYKTVSFRGFTTLGRDGEFPFATVIDGVVQPGQMNFNQELVNVEQIEVLRGPQGTLYGGGAIAGAINITTKKPTNDFEGGAYVQWLNGPEGRGNLTLSGPIIEDKLYFQTGVTAYTTDGLIPNLANELNADFGNGVTTRSSLIFEPTAATNINLTFSSTDSKMGGLWLAPVPDDEFDGPAVNPSEDQAGIVWTDLRNVSLSIEQELGDFATLTSISAYSHGEEYTEADGDFTAEPVYTQNVRFVDEAYSQELRLTSDSSGPFIWNVGAFFQHETRDSISNYGDVGTPPNFFSKNSTVREYETIALFGQASYDITDRLQVTAGLRVDWEDQTFDDRLTDEHIEQSFSEPQGKLAVSYDLSDDAMGYLSYSRGYRKGGFNPGSQVSLLTYDPETADTFEFGFKSSLLDRLITFNAAAFYTIYDGQLLQTSRVIPGEGIYIAISNLERTEVLGFELETTVRAHEYLTFSGSLGYSDVSIEEFLPEDPDAYNGNVTPQIYGFTAQGSIDIDMPLSQRLDLIAHADVSHRGTVYWDIENELKTSPKTFLNAKIGISNGEWTLSAIGRNLTDTRTPAAVGPHALGDVTLSSYNTPRQYGVELAVVF